MRRVLLVVLVIAGCKSTQDDFPLHPGGAGGGGGGGGSGGGDDIDGNNFEGPTLNGQVCQLADLRIIDQCDTTNIINLVVTLGGSAPATTDIDGKFSIEDPGGTGLIWHVTGTNNVPSLAPFDPASLTVYTMRKSVYQQLLADNQITLIPGQGAIVEHVVDNGVTVVDATALTVPATPQTFYDGSSSIVWDQDATGIHGMIWIPQAVSGGTVGVKVTPPGSGATPVTLSRPVEEASLTFSTFGL